VSYFSTLMAENKILSEQARLQATPRSRKYTPRGAQGLNLPRSSVTYTPRPPGGGAALPRAGDYAEAEGRLRETQLVRPPDGAQTHRPVSAQVSQNPDWAPSSAEKNWRPQSAANQVSRDFLRNPSAVGRVPSAPRFLFAQATSDVKNENRSPNKPPLTPRVTTPRAPATPRLATPRGRPPPALGLPLPSPRAALADAADDPQTFRPVHLPFSADAARALQGKFMGRDWAPMDPFTFKKLVRDLPVTADELSDEGLEAAVSSLKDSSGSVSISLLLRSLA